MEEELRNRKYRMYEWVVDVFNPDQDDIALMGPLRLSEHFVHYEEAVEYVNAKREANSQFIYQIRRNCQAFSKAPLHFQAV